VVELLAEAFLLRIAAAKMKLAVGIAELGEVYEQLLPRGAHLERVLAQDLGHIAAEHVRVGEIVECGVGRLPQGVGRAVSVNGDLRPFAVLDDGIQTGRESDARRARTLRKRRAHRPIAGETVVQIEDHGRTDRVNAINRDVPVVVMIRPCTLAGGGIAEAVEIGTEARLVRSAREHSELLGRSCGRCARRSDRWGSCSRPQCASCSFAAPHS